MIWLKRGTTHFLAAIFGMQIGVWIDGVQFRPEDLWRMVAVAALIGLVVAIFAELDAEQTG